MSRKPILGINRVCVENFGPITKGCIDLAKLTILVGPQKSGKTYLASLLYFLQKNIPSVINEAFFDVVKLVQRYRDREKLETEELKKLVIDHIRNYVFKRLKELFSTVFPKYFAYESINELIYYNKKYSIIEAYLRYKDQNFSLKITLMRDEREPIVDGNIDDVIEEMIESEEIWERVISQILVSVLISYQPIIPQHPPSTLYIPAERIVILPTFYTAITLLNTFYKSPTSPLIERGLRIKTPLIDYIDIVGAALSRGVKGKLMGDIGSFSVEHGRIIYVDERGWFFSVENTSSGIAQLIGILLPIEHLGLDAIDTVIIEEPEINLHANMHKIVTEYILDTLCRKIPIVIITTHSEHVLSTIGLALIKGLLKKSDVKAYLIYNGEINKLRVSQKEGIETPRTIVEAISRLANEALEAYERLSRL